MRWGIFPSKSKFLRPCVLDLLSWTGQTDRRSDGIIALIRPPPLYRGKPDGGQYNNFHSMELFYLDICDQSVSPCWQSDNSVRCSCLISYKPRVAYFIKITSNHYRKCHTRSSMFFPVWCGVTNTGRMVYFIEDTAVVSSSLAWPAFR